MFKKKKSFLIVLLLLVGRFVCSIRVVTKYITKKKTTKMKKNLVEKKFSSEIKSHMFFLVSNSFVLVVFCFVFCLLYFAGYQIKTLLLKNKKVITFTFLVNTHTHTHSRLIFPHILIETIANK